MRKIMILGMSAAAICLMATADTLVFKSGAKLIGTVERIEGGVIKFKTDDVGTVDVKQDKVAQMITEKANTILYADKTQENAVISMTNGAYMASGKPLDMGKVKAVNPEVETWHGSIHLSGSAQRGNTVGEQATLLANLKRRWEKDRFNFDGGYYFEQKGTDSDNKKKTEDRIVLSAQEDHFWVGKTYSYVNGKFERDRLNDLDRRFRLGAGLGYQWLDGEDFGGVGKWSFNQEVGAEYVKERWSNKEDDSDEDYAAFRYAHHLNWHPVWCPKIEVFHNFEYHPDVSEWDEIYIINSDVGFMAPIWNNWDLLGKFEWDYNSSPADSAKRSDLRYLLGLGYKW